MITTSGKWSRGSNGEPLLFAVRVLSTHRGVWRGMMQRHGMLNKSMGI